MIRRDIVEKIQKVSKSYGVISVTGPRQSGKTTLVKSLFPKHTYVNLENLAELEKVKGDPLKFLNSIKGGVIIDEIQKYPELLSYIQVSIDEDFKPSKFILTGSQNLLLLDKVSQSLAGRVSIVKLFPLSLSELQHDKKHKKDYIEQIYTGFYPAIYDKKLDPVEYYENYLNTYVQRDVRTIKNIGDLSGFVKFLKILATRIGQLLNLSEIGGQLGVSHKTITSWISILEASYIIFLLEPHFNNFGKRIIKSPKIYFTDVGLATNLLNLNAVEDIGNYYALGSLFENLVILDIYKEMINRGSRSNLYFFRDKGGNEVDLLIDRGNIVDPIEIKSSSSFHNDFLKGIEYYRSISGLEKGGSIIYSGKSSWDLKNTKILNYLDLKKLEF